MPIIEVILRIKCDNDAKHLPQSVMHNNSYHLFCIMHSLNTGKHVNFEFLKDKVAFENKVGYVIFCNMHL